MSYVRKSANIKRSVSFAPETLRQLDIVATKQGIATSELIRRFIDQGMTVEKSKDDIDFVRRQIREEIEMAFEKRMERMIKLQVKIGIMSYTSAYFNALIGGTLAKTAQAKGFNSNYHKMLEDAKKAGAAAMGARSEAVDELFRQMSDFNL